MVCATCLGVIALVQLTQGLLVANALVVLAGAFGLLYKLRVGPILLVILVASAQFWLEAGFGAHVGSGRPHHMMEVGDVLLCAAVLGYVAGHYRLQGLSRHLLPLDTRQRSGPPRRGFPWLRKIAPILRERRPASQITASEIAWLVATLPIWAVAAQLVWAIFPNEFHPLGLHPRPAQILLAVWLLAVGFWMVASVLNYWKHRRHDRATAQLYLQDLLWRDTRGEQRCVNRWLAWWKLARRIE